MPELPEVETIRQRLAPAVEGRSFERVNILDPRVTRPLDPREVMAELEGEVVANLDRRGKYLIFRFVSGRALLIHLRMTGNLLHGPNGAAAGEPHSRAVVTLDDGSEVIYRDVRRFGTWLLLEPGEDLPYLAERLGGEPLERSFTARTLAGRVARRTAPIKAAILDQKTVAGMGNIYADEALWDARIHPLRPAGELTPDELKRLRRSIRRALERGIERQGTTLSDYRMPDGGRGSMQHELRVYGRGGELCHRCGTPIEKIRVAGRGTWFCPRCQPMEPVTFQPV